MVFIIICQWTGEWIRCCTSVLFIVFQFEACHASDPVHCSPGALYTAFVCTVSNRNLKRYHLRRVHVLWVFYLLAEPYYSPNLQTFCMIACTTREYVFFRSSLQGSHTLQVTSHQAPCVHAGDEEVPFGAPLQEL